MVRSEKKQLARWAVMENRRLVFGKIVVPFADQVHDDETGDDETGVALSFNVNHRVVMNGAHP